MNIVRINRHIGVNPGCQLLGKPRGETMKVNTRLILLLRPIVDIISFNLVVETEYFGESLLHHHSFDFHCLTNFAKVSICPGWFLFGVSYYVNVQFTP